MSYQPTLEATLRVVRFEAIPESGWPVPQYVYVAQDVDGGPIKIGTSWNPRQRLAQLSSRYATKLRCLLVFAGGRDVERALHTRFQMLSLGHEWFAPEPDIRSFIEFFSGQT